MAVPTTYPIHPTGPQQAHFIFLGNPISQVSPKCISPTSSQAQKTEVRTKLQDQLGQPRPHRHGVATLFNYSDLLWRQPPGARLKLPEWDGASFPFLSPLWTGRCDWNSLQAADLGPPSVKASAYVGMLSSPGLHFEGAPETQGEASKPGRPQARQHCTSRF